MHTWQTITRSAEETELLAERAGRALRGGEVVELVADLGGGKTTFSRGLVRGMGSTDTVSSPTFTISKVYQAKGKQIHHFDFYRLHEAGIIADELAEFVGDPHTVVLVEWADVVQHVLPDARLTVAITQTPEGDRSLTFSYPDSLDYILKAIQA